MPALAPAVAAAPLVECALNVASSPGHSLFFNVTSMQLNEGPGAQAHVGDVTLGTDLIVRRHHVY